MSATGTGRWSLPAKVLWFGILPTVLGVIVAWISAAPEIPRYRTTMKVQLPRQDRNWLGSGESGLDDAGNMPDAATYEPLLLAVLEDPSTIKLAVRTRMLGDKACPAYFRGRDEADVIREVAAGISFDRIPGSSILDISVTGTRPDALPYVARQVWGQFVDMQRHLRSQVLSTALARSMREWQRASEEYHVADKARRICLTTHRRTETTIRTTIVRLADLEDALARELDDHESRRQGTAEPTAEESGIRDAPLGRLAAARSRLEMEEAVRRKYAEVARREEAARADLDRATEAHERIRRLRDESPDLGGVVIEPELPTEALPTAGPVHLLYGGLIGLLVGLLQGLFVAILRR